MVEKSIPHYIEYFLNDFLPKMRKNEADFIQQILLWPDEKKVAFHLAKDILEEESSKS